MSDQSYQSPSYGNTSYGNNWAPPRKQGPWGLSRGVLAIAGFLLSMVIIATIATAYSVAIGAGVLFLLAIAEAVWLRLRRAPAQRQMQPAVEGEDR